MNFCKVFKIQLRFYKIERQNKGRYKEYIKKCQQLRPFLLKHTTKSAFWGRLFTNLYDSE